MVSFLNSEREKAKQALAKAVESGERINLNQMSESQLIQHFQSKGVTVNAIGNGRLELIKPIGVAEQQLTSKSIYNISSGKIEISEILQGNVRKSAFSFDDENSSYPNAVHSRTYQTYPDSLLSSLPAGTSPARNLSISSSLSR